MDVDLLHAVLAALPAGSWVSYGDLGRVAGVGPRHAAKHMATCGYCPSPHRVLRADGTPGYDEQVGRPVHMTALAAEGVGFRNGRAEQASRHDRTDLDLLAAALAASSA